MDMNEATAKAISAERAIAGITIRDLSDRTGIPMSSLMRVLQAEREIKVNQVAKIAAAFEVYPHDLIEHAERILERSKPTRPVLLPPMSDAGETLPRSSDAIAAHEDPRVQAEFEAMEQD